MCRLPEILPHSYTLSYSICLLRPVGLTSLPTVCLWPCTNIVHSELLMCQLNVSDSHILILRALATYNCCTLLLHTHLGVYVHARMCIFGPRPVQTTINIVQPVSPNVQLALSIPPMLATLSRHLEPVKQHKIACTI